MSGARGGEGPWANDTVLRDTERTLQQPCGADRPGVHGKVENRKIEPARKIVGPHDVPVKAPVDRRRFGTGERAHMGDGDGSPAGAGERRARDAEVRRPAKVERVVDEPAFKREDVRKSGSEVCSCHEVSPEKAKPPSGGPKRWPLRQAGRTGGWSFCTGPREVRPSVRISSDLDSRVQGHPVEGIHRGASETRGRRGGDLSDQRGDVITLRQAAPVERQ